MSNQEKEEKEDELESKSKEELIEKIQELKRERDEYLEGWQRTKADFMNYKNKEKERRSSAKSKGREEVASSLLSVIDSFELSLASQEGEKIEKKGVKMIKDQLESSLEKFGLEKIEIDPGDEFTPETQEAIARKESEYPEGTVAEITEEGYRFQGEVLRPAKVKVSKS